MKRFIFKKDLTIEETIPSGGGWRDWDPGQTRTTVHFQQGDVVEVLGTHIESQKNDKMVSFCIFNLLRDEIIEPLDKDVQEAWKVLNK